MRKPGTLLRTPFASALLGGLVVAIAGLIAIEAGWIGDDDDPAAVTPATLARPAADEVSPVGEIYRRSNDGVVFVQAEQRRPESSVFDPFGGGGGGVATGSGFVIDDEGHILTNAHAVEGASRVEVQIGDAEDSVEAELVGTDPSTDVALLDVEADAGKLSPLELGQARSLEVGDPVVAIGNPFGLDRTVTSGIVSALQREIQAPNGFSITNVIQTDAAINPGNSGGPLLDASGRVIGINSQIASQSGGNEGVGFAVPIETAREVVDQLLEDGKVERPYLGITGTDVTPEMASALELGVEHGAMVSEAFEGGPAAEAGVRGASAQTTVDGQTFPSGGDIIVAVDGQEVTGMDDLIAAVDSRQARETITLTILRGDERREVEVELGTRPAEVQDSIAPSEP